MFFSLRIMRASSTRTGWAEPLSKRMISRGATLCFRIDSMHARSISPPLEASSTMKSTSLMIHPIEVHDAVEAAQLDAPAACDIDANAPVPFGRRQRVGISAELNHRR